MEVLLTFTCLIPRVKQFPSHPTPEVDNQKCPVQGAFDGDVRRLNQCCFYVYRWAINCARSIMKRSRRSCCERTLVRALPPSLPPPPPPVHRIIAYFPNSEWRSHHRKFTAQPFHFTPKIGLVHGLHLWNPLHVK